MRALVKGESIQDHFQPVNHALKEVKYMTDKIDISTMLLKKINNQLNERKDVQSKSDE